MLHTLKSGTINNWICHKYAQPVGLGEKWPGAYVVVSYMELLVSQR